MNIFTLRSRLTLYKWAFSASIQRPLWIRNWTIQRNWCGIYGNLISSKHRIRQTVEFIETEQTVRFNKTLTSTHRWIRWKTSPSRPLKSHQNWFPHGRDQRHQQSCSCCWSVMYGKKPCENAWRGSLPQQMASLPPPVSITLFKTPRQQHHREHWSTSMTCAGQLSSFTSALEEYRRIFGFRPLVEPRTWSTGSKNLVFRQKSGSMNIRFPVIQWRVVSN